MHDVYVRVANLNVKILGGTGFLVHKYDPFNPFVVVSGDTVLIAKICQNMRLFGLVNADFK